MNLEQVFILVERLRKQAIGEPKRVVDKGMFEYQDHSAKVVAVLKLIRAAHGCHNTMCERLRRGSVLSIGGLSQDIT
jgi:hypothetical protein